LQNNKGLFCFIAVHTDFCRLLMRVESDENELN